MLIAPSLLAADFANLQRDIEMVNESQADWFHLDIMDGLFVPNISYGMPVVKAIKEHAKKPLDVHLMIVDPDRYIHACTHLHRTVQAIRQEGMKAGVALNPHTPITVMEDIITDVDLLLIMSVNPGFGGQSFIENTYKKVSQAKELITKTGSKALIEVDGGVNATNTPKLVAAGADVLVAGSFVFNAPDPKKTIEALKRSV